MNRALFCARIGKWSSGENPQSFDEAMREADKNGEVTPEMRAEWMTPDLS